MKLGDDASKLILFHGNGHTRKQRTEISHVCVWVLENQTQSLKNAVLELFWAVGSN